MFFGSDSRGFLHLFNLVLVWKRAILPAEQSKIQTDVNILLVFCLLQRVNFSAAPQLKTILVNVQFVFPVREGAMSSVLA